MKLFMSSIRPKPNLNELVNPAAIQPMNSVANMSAPIRQGEHPSFNALNWVLVQTSHPGNIGSSARAIKTMGFERLTLVAPRHGKPSAHSDAIALASGARDVLEQASEVPNLGPVLKNCSLVLGLTSRERQFGPPELSWQEACQRATQLLMNEEQVALVFGTERTGLDNEALKLCSHRVYLEANPAYPSLNLAQAVMVCAYTLRQSLQAEIALQKNNFKPKVAQSELADPTAVAAMAEHWRQGLESIGYLDPDRPKKLMPRLQALFARAELHKEEIDLLRGIAKQMLRKK